MRHLLSAAAVWAGLLAASAAPASAAIEREFLQIIPAENFGFVAVPNLAELDRAVADLARRMEIEGGVGPLTWFRQQSQLNKGLRDNGTFGLFCLPKAGGVQAGDANAEGKGAGFAAFPADNIETFVGNFPKADKQDGGIWSVRGEDNGRECLFRAVGRYVVMTEPKNRELLASLKSDAAGSLGSKMSQDDLARIDAAQLVGNITPTGLRSAFHFLSAQARDAAAKAGENRDQLDRLARRLENVHAFLDQASGVTGLVSINDRGIQYRKMLPARADTNLAAYYKVAAAQQKALPLFSRLPAGNWTVAAGWQGHEPNDQFVDAVIRGFFNEYQVEKNFQGAQLEQLRTDLRNSFRGLLAINGALYSPVSGQGQGGRAGQAGQAGQAGHGWVPMGFFHTDDAKAYLGRFRAYAAAQERAVKAAGQQSDTYTRDAEKVGDVSADRIDLNTLKARFGVMGAHRDGQGGFDLWAMLVAWGQADRKFYIAPVDEKTLIWTVGDRSTLEQALQLAKQGAGDLTADASIRSGMAGVAENSRFLLAINPKPLASLAGTGFALANAKLPRNLPELQNAPAITMAVSFDQNAGYADWNVPMALLESLGKWHKELHKQLDAAPADGNGNEE